MGRLETRAFAICHLKFLICHLASFVIGFGVGLGLSRNVFRETRFVNFGELLRKNIA
jgi:hypothetical protein